MRRAAAPVFRGPNAARSGNEHLIMMKDVLYDRAEKTLGEVEHGCIR